MEKHLRQFSSNVSRQDLRDRIDHLSAMLKRLRKDKNKIFSKYSAFRYHELTVRACKLMERYQDLLDKLSKPFGHMLITTMTISRKDKCDREFTLYSQRFMEVMKNE